MLTVKSISINTVFGINRANSFTSKNINNDKGFSLIEIIISLILVSAILTVVFTMTVGGVVGGKKTQAIADLRTLSLQKTTEISNSLTNELKKFPLTENRVGSINPDTAINGYFDELNEAGCIIRRSTFVQPPIDIDPSTKGVTQPKGSDTKGNDSSSGNGNGDTGNGNGDTGNSNGGVIGDTGNGRLGDLGDGDSDTTNTTIDCSKSTYSTTNSANTSMNPVYRRQWTIVKGRPNTGDTTIAVVIIDKKTDQIVRSEFLVKVDGIATK